MRISLSACVIGGTSLAMRGVRPGLDEGHFVVAIISEDAAFLAFAREASLACFPTVDAGGLLKDLRLNNAYPF